MVAESQSFVTRQAFDESNAKIVATLDDLSLDMGIVRVAVKSLGTQADTRSDRVDARIDRIEETLDEILAHLMRKPAGGT